VFKNILWILWCSRSYQLINRIVALFDLTIFNSAESIISDRMTTNLKGGVEHQFSVFGGISILVIKAKLVLATAEERLDAIAHVIAECDAMGYAHIKFLPNTHVSQPATT
jgi:hypothetical protein